jgi:hypothetical protein
MLPRRWSAGAVKLAIGGALLAIAAVIAVLVAFPRKAPLASVARPLAAAAAAVSLNPTPAPSAPSIAPVTPPPRAPAVSRPAEPEKTARTSPAPDRVMSKAAASRALHAISRKVARCRHGRFWGRGYATVVFANDGSVHDVLIDPPFSMTVAGRCVAQALGSAHVPAFDGRSAFYRLGFYIAPH